MKIEQSELKDLNGVVTITIEPADYQEEVAKELKQVRQKAQMPGFRPGMVPAGLVKKMYGKGILADVLNKKVGEGLQKHIEDNKIQILGDPLPSENAPRIDLDHEDTFTFSFEDKDASAAPSGLLSADAASFSVLRDSFLYEPNASIMKAGCFAQLCRHFEVRSLHPNSHLFVASSLISDFPGRRFKIRNVSTMNKKELKKVMGGLSKANVSVRNFPIGAEELRRRLKLKDGGDTYLFGTTLADKTHVLLFCQRADNP